MQGTHLKSGGVTPCNMQRSPPRAALHHEIKAYYNQLGPTTPAPKNTLLQPTGAYYNYCLGVPLVVLVGSPFSGAYCNQLGPTATGSYHNYCLGVSPLVLVAPFSVQGPPFRFRGAPLGSGAPFSVQGHYHFRSRSALFGPSAPFFGPPRPCVKRQGTHQMRQL